MGTPPTVGTEVEAASAGNAPKAMPSEQTPATIRVEILFMTYLWLWPRRSR